jgi:membrane protein
VKLEWLMQPTTTAGRTAKFGLRVLRHFYTNNGLLLASALAYNTMLSIIPFCLVLVIALAQIFSDELVYETIGAELATIVPGLEVVLGEVLRAFPENRELVGGIGILVLIFFSTVAFRTLETAMAQIFHRPTRRLPRKLWVSAGIPYLYLVLIGIALLLLTATTAFLNALPPDRLHLMDQNLPMDAVTAAVIHGFAMAGLILLFTSLYLVFPVGKIRFRRALIGGITATVLWEGTRLLLLWFFSNLSLVSVVYGSLATMVIVLVSMEVAAVIVLFGAQVIAELEHSAGVGLPWYEE